MSVPRTQTQISHRYYKVVSGVGLGRGGEVYAFVISISNQEATRHTNVRHVRCSYIHHDSAT